MKIKLILSPIERTAIVVALRESGFEDLAAKISKVPEFDPADDGVEVELLRQAEAKAAA